MLFLFFVIFLCCTKSPFSVFFFFQAEDGIRDWSVTEFRRVLFRSRLLKAGTTAGQRWNMVGRRNGEPRIEIETLWTVGNEYPEHWPAPEHGWTLTIEGDPSMRVHFLTLASFTRNAGIAEHAQAANIATGMQVLNAVPAVCDAPAGFATNATLPLIRSATGFRG